MKKLIIILLVMSCMTSLSQTVPTNISKSKFTSAQNNNLLLKIDVKPIGVITSVGGQYSGTLTIENRIVTNVANPTSKYLATALQVDVTSFIDRDELDFVIASLTYMQKNINTTSNYTFTTRDGITFYTQAKSYELRLKFPAREFIHKLSFSKMDELIILLQKSKDVFSEK